ncbi:MAG: hypothetical protein M0002_07400 [Rhodospirillales bacterium]|nr:hypothetical protein [Rhodospirillales bacterium]
MRFRTLVVLAAGLLVLVALGVTLPTRAQPGAQPPGPVGARTWQSQCSACHMAYPPWLLPARSWRAIIGDLSHHFGEDASLSKGQTARALAFGVSHAADSRYGKAKFLRGLLPRATPLYITDLPWWRAKHRRFLLSGAITLGPGPHAAANCGRCHGAGRGRAGREHGLGLIRGGGEGGGHEHEGGN